MICSHPERMKRQVEVLESDPDLEVVSTDAFVVDDENRVLGGRLKGKITSTSADILWHNGPIHASIMARRTWCARFPYVHSLFRGEDLELWARALPVTNHFHLAEQLYFIRENPDVNVAKFCRTISAHSRVFRSFAGKQSNVLVRCGAAGPIVFQDGRLPGGWGTWPPVPD